MQNFDYFRPASLDEAATLLKGGPDRHILAGGQSILNQCKVNDITIGALVDISGLGLGDISVENNRLRIGAAATHSDVARSELVQSHCAGLAELAGVIGDNAVRNRGTIGGAVAINDPSGDYPVALLALDSWVVTINRTVSIADLLANKAPPLGAGEIVLAVEFAVGQRMAFSRMEHPATRGALVNVVAVNSTSKKRYSVAGLFAEGARLFDPNTEISPSANEVVMIDDSFGTARYRAHLAQVLAARAA